MWAITKDVAALKLGWFLGGVAMHILFAVTGFAQKSTATPDDPFAGVHWDNCSMFEHALRTDVEAEAQAIAEMYRNTDWLTYPGIHELGVQVSRALSSQKRPLDFESLVSHNHTFWRAEREMSVLDPSFPYLVAMLAYLSDERATAARMIAIAQATLPLTPWQRRLYARPEAYMLQLEIFYQQGIRKRGERLMELPYEETKAVLGERIARWPYSSGLWQILVELEVAQVQKQIKLREDSSLLTRVIYEEVGINIEEARLAREYDIIMGAALEHTVGEWLDGGVVAQRWNSWILRGDPAVEEEVAQTVALYEKHGRFDLAWLFWRHQMALNPLSSEQDREHWKIWSEELLGEDENLRLQKLVEGNAVAGTAKVLELFPEMSEAWSGDSGINPLIVIQAERRLAVTEARLRFIKPGSKRAAIEHLMRASIFYDIGSIKGLERELNAARGILNQDNKGLKVFEAHLASLQGDYHTVKTIYRALLDEVQHSQGKKEYAFFHYIAGDYEGARTMLLKLEQNVMPGYRAIFLGLLARRNGETAAELLHQEKDLIQSGTWVDSGIRFLTGEIPEEVLLSRAKEGSTFDVLKHECEAWFWISQVRLAEGKLDEGIYALRRCLSTGFTSFVEYKIAQAELKRLEAIHEKIKPREGPVRNSRFPIVS